MDKASSSGGQRLADKSTIPIGALIPLTRPGWVEAGRHLLGGLELAVSEINDAGGIIGRPLELLVRDTAADPNRAREAVDELASLGVVALAGEYHSVAARAAASRADAIGLPFLCSSAVLDTLTGQPTKWVARLAPMQSHGGRPTQTFFLELGIPELRSRSSRASIGRPGFRFCESTFLRAEASSSNSTRARWPLLICATKYLQTVRLPSSSGGLP